MSNTLITWGELMKLNFRPLDKSRTRWSWDGDRILYVFPERTLYDADEVSGNDIPLCKIKTVEDLIEMVYSYFNEDINIY